MSVSVEGEIDDKAPKTHRFLFPSDETDELLKVIYDTLEDWTQAAGFITV